MEEFLGVLFCGGKGVRLGEITKYISKTLLPVYDTPVFRFGLELLERAESVNEIIILTNRENDKLMREAGYNTIIQDDARVNDMFSGWKFIKEETGTSKNGVLVPGDNICEVKIENLIKSFIKKESDFLFSLHRLNDKKKLSAMGSFDIKKNKFHYKKNAAGSGYGVIAPYIIRNELEIISAKNVFESKKAEILFHKGYWFDIGDHDSLFAACKWRQKNKSKRT
ncbi:MAG: sugar phosphate nucleotidyltransferase [Ignavibacteria bacterium]